MEPDQRLQRPPSLVPNLADWRFEHYLTMRLLPLFYILLVGGAAVAVAGIAAACFWISTPVGLIASAAAGDSGGSARRPGILDHGSPNHANY